MKKSSFKLYSNHYFLFILVFFLFVLPSAEAVSSEIFQDHFKKISYYAEQYDTGNINYAQLMIHISSERQEMESYIGQKNFMSEKAREVLGEPTRTSKYLYSKKDGEMIKTENINEVWEKVIYDGKKIKIYFKLEPFIYYDEEKKKEFIMTNPGLYQEFKGTLNSRRNL